ncbi:MAG: NTP transferase domain-containing protein [Phycisphaeraceae bacterium]|nr:NTP transferase domain-containing protein [Phycisphaeraceae bacterium]
MPHSATHHASPSAIIMAAGKGTRMKSDLPKVMHPVAGRPMVEWVIDAALEAGAAPVVLVIGHGAELVRSTINRRGGRVEFVVQEPQLGTGHAVDQARPLVEAGRLGSETLVLAGDGPLIRAETLRTLLEAHRARRAVATLATSQVADPTGYGRIVRRADGSLDRIVEERDASPEIKRIREINPSYYCFDTAQLYSALSRVTNTNAAREYYLTDVFALLGADGGTVAVVDAVPAEDVLSINTPEQRDEVEALLSARLLTIDGGASRPHLEGRP